MVDLTPTEQGGQVNSITVVPVNPVPGQPTLMQLNVVFSNGNSQTAMFTVPTGPLGLRGTGVRTGPGAPPVTPDCVAGDVYINTMDGHIWYFDGTNWDDTGETLLPQILAPDDLEQVVITQDGTSTTNNAGRSTNAVVNVEASQYLGSGNPILAVQSFIGDQDEGWRDAELARAGVWVVQMNLMTTIRRDRMLKSARENALKYAIQTTTRLGTVTTPGL